jgi:hypothetical protein
LPVVIVRTLTREYRLIAGNDEVARSLAFMAITPDIAGVELERVDIGVEEVFGFLRVILPGNEVVEGSADHFLGRFHRVIVEDVRKSEPAAPFIHGATIIGPAGNRFALIGRKACGKTTLTLAALAHGFRVEGDEHIVVRTENTIARPRTLRVKAGSLALVPSLADAIRNAPHIRDWEGSPIYAVSPEIGGKPWRITAGRLDQLVFLEANHGGRSVMTPIPTSESFRLLMADCLLPVTAVSAGVAKLRKLAVETPSFHLQVGDLAGALRHLGHLGA